MPEREPANHLKRIPVFALRSVLVRRYPEAGLASLDGDDLRQRVRAKQLLTTQEIEELFDEWRYAERPSIRLALFLKEIRPRWSEAELKGLLESALSADPETAAIMVRDVDVSFDSDIAEVAIAYPRALSYVDLEERPAEVTELGFGFAWLGYQGKFVAIAADDDQGDALRVKIGALVGHEPVWVSISKGAMDAEFPLAHVASISHYDQGEHVRQRVAGEDLSKRKIFGEIVARDKHQQRSGAIYSETTDAGRRVNVNVNADRGRLNFLGKFSATELRTWGLSKVRAVAKHIHELRKTRPEEFIEGLRASVQVTGLARAHVLVTQPIVVSLVHARLNRAGEFPLSVSASDLAAQLPEKHGELTGLPYCKRCQEVQKVTCSCGKTRLQIDDQGAVACANGHIGDLTDMAGHHFTAEDLRDGLQYSFSLEYLDLLSEALASLDEPPIDATREFVSVRADRLQWAHKDPFQAGTYTCVYADIIDSTSLLRTDPNRHSVVFRTLRRRLIESGLSRSGRYCKGTGDGAFAVFGEAAEALRAAIELRELVRRKRDLFEGHSVRVGVATGRIEPELGDYKGMAINLAARLQAKAVAPFFIAVDEATRRAVTKVPLQRLATLRSLKGIDMDGGYYAVPERLSQRFRAALAAP